MSSRARAVSAVLSVAVASWAAPFSWAVVSGAAAATKIGCCTSVALGPHTGSLLAAFAPLQLLGASDLVAVLARAAWIASGFAAWRGASNLARDTIDPDEWRLARIVRALAVAWTTFATLPSIAWLVFVAVVGGA